MIELVPGETYTLAIAPDGTPDDNQDGDLDILAGGGPLGTDGGDGVRPTLDGAGIDRLLDVQNGASLTLDRVQVNNGASNGGEWGGGVRALRGGARRDRQRLRGERDRRIGSGDRGRSQLADHD